MTLKISFIIRQFFNFDSIRRIVTSLERISEWSDGAMVLGKLPVPGRPANLDNSRAWACCACCKC